MAIDAGVPGKGMEQVKLLASVLVLVAASVLFMYFSEESLLYRVLGVLMSVGVSVGIFLTTERGRTTATFLKAARIELRKVIWPTRTETLQTTLIVFVMVLLVAIFLWALDMLLAWLMGMLIR